MRGCGLRAQVPPLRAALWVSCQAQEGEGDRSHLVARGRRRAVRSVDKCGRQERRLWKRTQMLADVSSLGRDHRRRPTSAQGSLWGESEHGLPSKKGRWVASSRVRCGSLASEDMARGGGCQSARVFAIGCSLELLLVGAFSILSHTVLRKWAK